MSGEDWSDAELEVCVARYAKAIKQKGAEREIDRAALIKAAVKDGLQSRGQGSVSRRMGNLSAVREKHGLPWVLGWKPQANVGSGMTPRIEAIMKKYDLL